MAAYEYQALDSKGRRKQGVQEADSARQVRQILREQGLTPLEVTESTEKVRREATGFALLRPSMSTGELALITRQLATLVAAALPIEEALKVQHQGSAKDTLRLHQAEQWRDRLIAEDEALEAWLQLDPDADLQRLRTLVRQARKDAVPAQEGEAPRHGKSYREIFQLVRAKLDGDAAAAQAAEDGVEDEEDA